MFFEFILQANDVFIYCKIEKERGMLKRWSHFKKRYDWIRLKIKLLEPYKSCVKSCTIIICLLKIMSASWVDFFRWVPYI
jgi:hypothetical protein